MAKNGTVGVGHVVDDIEGFAEGLEAGIVAPGEGYGAAGFGGADGGGGGEGERSDGGDGATCGEGDGTGDDTVR